MDELIALTDLERRSGILRENETPTEYVREVLRSVDVDEETAETVVEAYQYGLFAAEPTFGSEQREALERFADALPNESSAETDESGVTATAEEAQTSETTDVAPGRDDAGSDESVEAEDSGESSAESASTPTHANGGAAGLDRTEQDRTSRNRVREFVGASTVGWRPGGDLSTARLGTWLVVLSVLLLVASIAVSAALAPSVGEGGTDGSSTAGSYTPENNTLVGLQVGGKVVEYDSQGNSVAATNKLSYGGAYFGVSKLENGSVLAAYMRGGYDECAPYDPKCPRTGVRILDFRNDPNDVQYEWSYPIRTVHSSEVHDAEFLPSGDLLVAGMEYERIFVVNHSTGNVTWQWNASSFYDAPEDPTQEDWLHINDVDRIGEGRYMVSVRNEYQILIVERGKGVVEVINEEQDPDLFKAQHNPQYLGPGKILVADSENDRVVEIHRKDGEWEIVWELKSAGGIELDWPRDADRLPNGNTLITDTHNERIIEVNRDGEVVWSVETGRVPYEADRLPDGEYPAGDPYRVGEGRQSIGESSDDLPVFSYLLASLRHVAPLPYWVTDWHLLVVALSLTGIVLGGVLRWRGADRDTG